MKRRKKSLLLIVLVLTMMCLTACGCSSNHTRVNDVSEPFETEITTAETKATTSETKQPLKTEETTVETVPLETEETTVETVPLETEAVTEEVKPQYGNLKIQSLEEIKLDGDLELPYEMTIFSEATDALDNPLVIIVNDEAGNNGKLTFSYINEDGKVTLNALTTARIFETNKDISYTRGIVNHMGNIATFSLDMPLNIENSSTALYQLSFEDEENYYAGFFAFRFTTK